MFRYSFFVCSLLLSSLTVAEEYSNYCPFTITRHCYASPDTLAAIQQQLQDNVALINNLTTEEKQVFLNFCALLSSHACLQFIQGYMPKIFLAEQKQLLFTEKIFEDMYAMHYIRKILAPVIETYGQSINTFEGYIVKNFASLSQLLASMQQTGQKSVQKHLDINQQQTHDYIQLLHEHIRNSSKQFASFEAGLTDLREQSSKQIDASLMQFDGLNSICASLRNLCETLQETTEAHTLRTLPLSDIGFHLLNIYYAAVYATYIQEQPNQNGTLMFNSKGHFLQPEKRVQQLPHAVPYVDMSFFEEEWNNLKQNMGSQTK